MPELSCPGSHIINFFHKGNLSRSSFEISKSWLFLKNHLVVQPAIGNEEKKLDANLLIHVAVMVCWLLLLVSLYSGTLLAQKSSMRRIVLVMLSYKQ
jgi:hypothetical protein